MIVTTTERAWRSLELEIQQIFQKHKRLFKRPITSAKGNYFNSQIIESSTCKAWYSVMKNLLGSTKSSPLPTTFKKEELPQVLIDYFTNKILTIWTKLDHTPLQPSQPPFSTTPLAVFRPVPTSEVSKTLKTMNIKSCDLDPIPAQRF